MATIVPKLISRICLFALTWAALGCKNTTEKNASVSSIAIDSSLVEDFLKDPRDNSTLDKLGFESICELSKNQNPMLLPIAIRRYYDCEYAYQGKKVAEMKSSILKTDSTWVLGTNGFQLHHFRTNQQTFPLKNGLKINSTTEEFEKVFGIPNIAKNTHTYNFEFDTFSSILTLEFHNNRVYKMSVANSDHKP